MNCFQINNFWPWTDVYLGMYHSLGVTLHVNTSRNFLMRLENTLHSWICFLEKRKEGYIIYLLKVWEKLCLFVCVRSLSIVRKRCKTLFLLCLVIHVCLSSYNLHLVFYDEYNMGVGDISQMFRVDFSYASSYTPYFGNVSLLKCYFTF